MNKKAALGIMLSVIIVSTLSIAFYLQPVRALEQPIEVWSDYRLDRDITFAGDGFIIKANNVTLDLNGHTITGSGVGEGVNLTDVNRVIVKNGKIGNFYDGIYLFGSRNSTLMANTILNCKWDGILLGGDGARAIIITGNTFVNNDNGGIEIYGEGNTLTRNYVIGPSSFGICVTGSANTVTENYIMKSNSGIYLCLYGSENVINANTLLNNTNGIDLWLSGSNSVVGNKILNSDQYGIWLRSSKCNTIRGDTIVSSNVAGIGIDDYYSCNNTIYYNNLIENRKQVEGNIVVLSQNIWDDGGLYKCSICGQKRSKGNYWSDYSGRDDGSRTQAHNCPCDGIGDTDTPHLVVDKYPLTAPWVPTEGDINIDGTVNIIDIASAAKNYGKTT